MVQINSIKRTFLSLALVWSLSVSANVTFKFSGSSIAAGPLKTKMENNVSALLSEIDRAGRAGTSLNLAGLNMEQGAKTRLSALWEDARFVCDESTYISKCLNDAQGYQIRALRITMKPLDSTYEQSLKRELTISLNKNGVITGVRPALENQEDISKIMSSTGGVADTYMRREILKWVEDFRCYYNEKNLRALEQIFSDDALIITGSVTTSQKRASDGVQFERGGVKYTVQSKEQYIQGLRTKVFRPNSRLNVQFDHIEVVRHSAKPDYYGVKLHQLWDSSNYKDNGWLFLLWDFTDKDRPQIHVRTWQDMNEVAEDGVFSLDDFFIP